MYRLRRMDTIQLEGSEEMLGNTHFSDGLENIYTEVYKYMACRLLKGFTNVMKWFLQIPS